MVFLLLTILQKILGQTAQNPTANSAQETMPSLLAKHMTCNTATDRAQKAPLAFAHGRCVGVIVRRIRVAGLWCELLLLLLLRHVGVVRWLLLVLAGLHALLVGLVLRIGIVVAMLRSWCTTAETVSILAAKDRNKASLLVSCISLRVARIVCAVLMALNTHLESTMLRRAEAVRPGWWGKSLILVAAVLRWVVRLLGVALMLRRLLLAVALGGILVVALRLIILWTAVRIVGS
jgi:hypothetical protein